MDIKERIARELFVMAWGYADLWDKSIQQDKYYKRADQILNLPVSEERDCPICYKGGLIGELTNPEYRGCARCNSTGKLHSKTLKQLIEEAQNG